MSRPRFDSPARFALTNCPGGSRRTAEEPVDVLIIGAGASGAALAWSLAATRMNILCMEPGDWMDPSQYPGMRTDWEARQMGDFSFSPNTRGRQEDHPVNDGSSPIQVSRYNGVADAWPLACQTLAPCYDVTARMMGVYDRQSIPIRRS